MPKQIMNIADLALNADQVDGEHVEVRFVPLSMFDLDRVLWKENAKKHDIGGVYESIERYGFIDPPKWDARLNGGHGGMIYGNGRTKTIVSALLQAKKAGLEPPRGIPIARDGVSVAEAGEWCIPVKFGIDQLSEAIAQAAAIDHNNLTMAGGDFDHFGMMKMWEEGPYLGLLQQIAEAGITPVTVDAEAIGSLLLAQSATPPPGGTGSGKGDGDYDGKNGTDDIVSRVKSGEVWTIGPHRIMCGDCRSFAEVDFLLAGRKINVAMTSPPYASQRKYDEKSEFKPIHPDEYVDWFEAVQASIRLRLATDGSYFVNIKEHVDDGQRHLYVRKLVIRMVEVFGWRFVDEFCWERPGAPGAWPDRFKNSWEPVLHFANGKGIKFNPKSVAQQSDAAIIPGERRIDPGNGTYWNMPTETGEGLALPSNVLRIGSASGESMGHQAAYPIALPEFFIKAFSDSGDLIYDPFMGSGTTGVAASRCQRISCGMEISPVYCEIILRRLETETGQTAKKDALFQ